jgi:hypothetical protein
MCFIVLTFFFANAFRADPLILKYFKFYQSKILAFVGTMEIISTSSIVTKDRIELTKIKNKNRNIILHPEKNVTYFSKIWVYLDTV